MSILVNAGVGAGIVGIVALLATLEVAGRHNTKEASAVSARLHEMIRSSNSADELNRKLQIPVDADFMFGPKKLKVMIASRGQNELCLGAEERSDVKACRKVPWPISGLS